MTMTATRRLSIWRMTLTPGWSRAFRDPRPGRAPSHPRTAHRARQVVHGAARRGPIWHGQHPSIKEHLPAPLLNDCPEDGANAWLQCEVLRRVCSSQADAAVRASSIAQTIHTRCLIGSTSRDGPAASVLGGERAASANSLSTGRSLHTLLTQLTAVEYNAQCTV